MMSTYVACIIGKMSTLSNVEALEGEQGPSSVKFTLDSIPEAKNSKTGVSVRYAHDPNKNWYVFRASYGRVDKACDYLVNDGTFTYIAKRHSERVVNGKRKKLLRALIPNILFVYTTPEKAERYIKYTPDLNYLSYYYNHFEKNEQQKNPPLTISCAEMENFILATCNMNEHILFVKPYHKCHYKNGDMVIIKEGPFTGVYGRVARISGQQRVIVTLSQFGLISTAYIPTAFIERLNTNFNKT